MVLSVFNSYKSLFSILTNMAIIFEPVLEISNNVVCMTNKGSDQPAHMRRLVRAFTGHINIL